MSLRSVKATIWGAAVLTVGVGISLSWTSLQDLRTTREVLRQRHDDMAALEALAGSLSRYEKARNTFGLIPGGRPVRLDAMLAGLGSRVDLGAVRETVKELTDGWVLRKKEVVVGEGPLQEVLAVIRQAEAQRPPWRLDHCVIRASAHTPGYGSAVLTFAALEKRR